jgi:hypothetical protein
MLKSSNNNDDLADAVESANTLPTIPTIDLSRLTTIDISSLSQTNLPPLMPVNYQYGNISGGNVGCSGSSGSVMINTGAGNSQWTSNNIYTTNITSIGSSFGASRQPPLKVHGDAEFEGKVIINGQNISEFMETISKRLAILVPDPEKLEHFEALKKAYNHYKTLEALCEIPKEDDKPV